VLYQDDRQPGVRVERFQELGKGFEAAGRRPDADQGGAHL
jgi:hypothetical protein